MRTHVTEDLPSIHEQFRAIMAIITPSLGSRLFVAAARDFRASHVAESPGDALEGLISKLQPVSRHVYAPMAPPRDGDGIAKLLRLAQGRTPDATFWATGLSRVAYDAPGILGFFFQDIYIADDLLDDSDLRNNHERLRAENSLRVAWALDRIDHILRAPEMWGSSIEAIEMQIITLLESLYAGAKLFPPYEWTERRLLESYLTALDAHIPRVSPSTPYLFQRVRPDVSIDVIVKIWRQVLATLIPSARKSILAGTRIEWIVQSDIVRPDWPLESSSSGAPDVIVSVE